MGEGGGFGGGGVEGWGEKAYNCNWITIKIKNIYVLISDKAILTIIIGVLTIIILLNEHWNQKYPWYIE